MELAIETLWSAGACGAVPWAKRCGVGGSEWSGTRFQKYPTEICMRLTSSASHF